MIDKKTCTILGQDDGSWGIVNSYIGASWPGAVLSLGFLLILATLLALCGAGGCCGNIKVLSLKCRKVAGCSEFMKGEGVNFIKILGLFTVVREKPTRAPLVIFQPNDRTRFHNDGAYIADRRTSIRVRPDCVRATSYSP